MAALPFLLAAEWVGASNLERPWVARKPETPSRRAELPAAR
jgi:hypothetical protein